ncbi:MAG: matrixin family metalloprotease, partial [Nocardioidaceae bacterium]|nr:matrixin family metalloprotease [Nocardioidaceae bacterium]
RATRLLPLPTAPAGSGGYELIGISADATPTRFDPCRPLHYVVNPDRAPRGGVGLVRQAVARASAATGLRFTYDGRTDEPWTKTRRPVQRQRYGDRWVPVLIGWATDREDPELAGFVAGVGGGYSVSREGGTEHFVTGQVVLDLDAFRRLTRERDRATARGIVQHELGHVVGLDHVDDSSQLMYRETRDGVTDYADGDLRGLAIAGDGPCLPDD